MMLTIETFNEGNRSKIIGNSLYRICRVDSDSGQWFIFENHQDNRGSCGARAYFNAELQPVIDKFNSINKEREIAALFYD